MVVCVGATGEVGCTPPSQGAKTFLDASGFRLRLVEGAFISDDYYITNLTGHNLTDVHLTLTATGVAGDSKSLTRYWAVWPNGTEKKASATIADNETVVDVQRVDVDGHTTDYRFSFYVGFDK